MLHKFSLYAVVLFVLFSFTCRADTALTILHTNDLHAHLLPSNTTGQDCQEGTDCLGGFARLFSVIDAERKKNPDVLYFDAGDRFSGTFFYTLHKEKDFIPLFNLLKPDVLTLGNHEFDDSLSVLENFLKHVNTPCVLTNADFSKKDALNKKIIPSLTLIKNGEKIGVLGVLSQEARTSAMHLEDITLTPPSEALKPEIENLKKSGVAIVIVLSHLGIEEEKKLAQNLPEIDIIVGGHTHTLLANQNTSSDGPYPIVIEHPDSTRTLIVSAGCLGRYIGKLEVNFDEKGQVKAYKGDTIPLSDKIPQDTTISDIIQSRLQNIETELNQSIQQNPDALLMTENQNYCAENCPIGQAITDMVLREIPEADIVLMNSGSFRSGLESGHILFKHLIQVLPFDSRMVKTKMTGQELKDYIQKGLTKYTPGNRVNAMLQIAGGAYQFNPVTRKIISLKIKGKTVSLNKTYNVILPLFLAKGGDGFSKTEHYELLPKNALEYIQDYLHKQPYTPKPVHTVQKLK